MNGIQKKKPVIIFILLFVLLLGMFAISQILMLQEAHSTFDTYYAFRGCNQLLKKTSTYGVCQLPSGQVIKLVMYRGKWYLDKDLPTCIGSFCL